jgi:hypothetical protein
MSREIKFRAWQCCEDVFGWDIPCDIHHHTIIGNIFENTEILKNE